MPMPGILGVGRGGVVGMAEAGAEELLVKARDDPLRDVAAAVVAHVYDEAFLADLGVIPLEEFVGARRAHVGDVEVTDAPVGGLGDAGVGALDVVVVAEGILGGDGCVSDFTRALGGRGGVEGEGNRVRVVAQMAVGVVVPGEGDAVDFKDVIARAGINTDFRERGTIFGLGVIALIDAGDFIAVGLGVELDGAAGEGVVGACGAGIVAALDVGMADVELGDHFAEDIVEVAAVRDVGEEGAVLAPECVPVVAMEVGDVEVVAVFAPDLGEDLRPFLGGVDVGVEVVGLQGGDF